MFTTATASNWTQSYDLIKLWSVMYSKSRVMIQWNVANPPQRITSTLPFMPCRDPKLPYPGPKTFIHLVQNTRGPPSRGIYVLEWIAWVWSLSQAKMTMPFPSPTPHLILWSCVIFFIFLWKSQVLPPPWCHVFPFTQFPLIFSSSGKPRLVL